MILFQAEPPAIVETASQDVASQLLNNILALQQPNGAFPDEPGGTVVNEDSNLLYLLTGLADYAEARNDPRAWQAVERGLVWLGNRLWSTGDPMPGAFPDALPLDGSATPLGSPPVAAIGATAARFVALVGRLPVQSMILRQIAMDAWTGLDRWNLDSRGFIWNCWSRNSKGKWTRSNVCFAADQADFLACFHSVSVLGFQKTVRDPFLEIPMGCLAMDQQGKTIPLEDSSQEGAWAVLAFDGPYEWQLEALANLKRLDRPQAYVISLAGRAALGDEDARDRLLQHLSKHPLPSDRDKEGSPVYLSVAGFVLRALVRIDGSFDTTLAEAEK